MKNGEYFVKEILDAINSPFDKVKVSSILSMHSGESIYIPVLSSSLRRVDVAEKMLGSYSNAEIVEALRHRFQISKRTAQKDVQKARKSSSK